MDMEPFFYKSTSLNKKEPIFYLPPLVIGLMSFCFLCWLVPEWILGERGQEFYQEFGFIPATLILEHRWYSLVTYSFLHGSFTHLAFNMVWLIVFVAPVVWRSNVLLIGWLWSCFAAMAALTHFLFYSDSDIVMIGASGAIAGFMGLAVRYGFWRTKAEDDFAIISSRGSWLAIRGNLISISQLLRTPALLLFVLLWLLSNLLIGIFQFNIGPAIETGSRIAWDAHIGGFLAGFFRIGCLKSRDG